MKRLRKEHIRVLMKVWLNAGKKTNKQLLNEYEMKEFNQLVEEGYIEIVEKHYANIPFHTGFNTVMENLLTNMEILCAPYTGTKNQKVISNPHK